MFLRFEEAEYNISVIRRLKKMAYTDLNAFISIIENKENLKRYLKRINLEDNSVPKTLKEYRQIKKPFKDYVRFINFINLLGEVSYNTIILDDDFSPFYSKRREIPLRITIKLSNIKQIPKESELNIILYSTGLLVASLSVAENIEANAGSSDEEIFEIIKYETNKVKTEINRNTQTTVTNYAFYYYDRHKFTIQSSNNKNFAFKNHSNSFAKFESTFAEFYISSRQSFLLIKEENDLPNVLIFKWLAVFELGLLQRYYLNTRDSYIDRSIKLFNSSQKNKIIESNLIDFIEILREVQFIKDEGGNYKLFNNEDLVSLYNIISNTFNLNSISLGFETKSARALNFFDIVSSIKRERTNVRLAIIMLILNIIMIVDIIIRLFLK